MYNLSIVIPVVVLLAILLIKPLRNIILQTFFGIVFVPEKCIGLVIKKFALGNNGRLPEGRIIAIKGEAGYQAQTLAPGLHWGKWRWQYEIKLQELIVIPSGKIGLIIAKDGKDLPNGQVLARYSDCALFQDAVKFMETGYKGRQTQFITPGVYRINTYLFEVSITESIEIEDNKVGIVTVKDGIPLDTGAIAGVAIPGHNKFQDPDAFLSQGGQRGLQSEVILAGLYNINPWFAEIEQTYMVEIPIGTVGVVVSYFGKDGVDLSGDTFKHGNIVSRGEKGVWAEPLQPGKYAINRYIMSIEIVPTTNLVLNWADSRSESHKLDENLCTIKVRSKDGFTFNLDVSQIIHVPMNEAPKVIARFGNMKNLVNQVLEPTIGNYFRNSAQNSDVIDFLSNRVTRQDEAKVNISKVLEGYNVNAVDTLIGDIVPPEALMKTLTDRKLAQESNTTYEHRIIAEKTRQELEKQTNLANMQGALVSAEQGVLIAQRNADAAIKTAEGKKQSTQLDAEAKSYQMQKEAEGNAAAIRSLGEAEASKISTIGRAEAEKIDAIGKANAEAYRGQAAAIGQNNLAKMRIVETIGQNKITLIPKVLIAGGNGGNGAVDGLLGLKLLEDINKGLLDNSQPADGTSN